MKADRPGLEGLRGNKVLQHPHVMTHGIIRGAGEGVWGEQERQGDGMIAEGVTRSGGMRTRSRGLVRLYQRKQKSA